MPIITVTTPSKNDILDDDPAMFLDISLDEEDEEEYITEVIKVVV